MNVIQRAVNWSASGFIYFIAKLPGTNFRTFMGVMTAAVYVIGVMVGVILDKIDDGKIAVISSVGLFLLAQMGLDVKQFIEKRKTFQPSPPVPPDVEDAPAQTETKST